jgi:hypothetical protein
MESAHGHPIKLLRAQLPHGRFPEHTIRPLVGLGPDVFHLATMVLPLAANKENRAVLSIARLDVNEHPWWPQCLILKYVENVVAQLERLRGAGCPTHVVVDTIPVVPALTEQGLGGFLRLTGTALARPPSSPNPFGGQCHGMAAAVRSEGRRLRALLLRRDRNGEGSKWRWCLTL